jgi:Peptidase inhibitor family I36
MLNLRKAFAALYALFLAAVVVLSGAGSARAAWSDCGAAQFCIFDGTSGTGLKYSWSVGYILTLSNDCLTLTGSQNNMASSLYYNGSFSAGNYIVVTSEPSGVLSPARNITANGYQDANLAASPGITAFGNTISRICVRN